MFKKYFYKSIKLLFILSVSIFVLLEIVLAIYIPYAEIRVELPTYTLRNTQGFWFDLDEGFGTLHLPNDSYRQKKYCYDIVYNTNSKGLRDKERALKSSKKRIVCLGDSFTEGCGVQVEDRLTNILESEIKIPHLNFGLAGNFGSTQYMIMYKTLAKNYDHDAVLISILPSNDFIDDDYEVSVTYGENRYTPFLKGDYPDYDLVYHVSDIKKSKARPKQQSLKGKILKNFTYSYNMYSYMRAMKTIEAIPKDSLLQASKVPTYFNFTTKQINRMQYAIETIKKMAGDKKVMVYSIPILKELEAYRKDDKNPLGRELRSICDSINVEYLDLLPIADKLSKSEQEGLFLTCDGHWSKAGNEFAKKTYKV